MECQPWLLVEGLTPGEAHTSEEHWCGVLQEVALPGCDSTEAFLQEAVRYVNTQCWGSLACSVWVHPDTEKRVCGIVRSRSA